MTDQDKPVPPDRMDAQEEALDEFAELEQAIRRRLHSNQRFLERFLDEDFDDEEEDAVLGDGKDGSAEGET